MVSAARLKAGESLGARVLRHMRSRIRALEGGDPEGIVEEEQLQHDLSAGALPERASGRNC
jgi:hypothetical protein